MNRHEVLIGPYRSGKSRQLLEKAIEHCRAQKNLADETLIVVPSQRYRALTEKRLQKLLAQDNQKIAGLSGLKILTFKQFCQASLLKAGVFTKNLPDAARSALVTNIGRELIETGKIDKLAPVINFSGTQAAILKLIDEWQAAGYRADKVLKQIKEKETNGHHIELAQIYSQYEQILHEHNYIDEHGLMFRLIDLLKSTDRTNELSNFIVVDGFDRWHILQLQLLKALTKHVPEIYISFDYEKPGENLLEEYAWKEKNYEQLKGWLDGTFKFVQSSSSDIGAGHSPVREVFCAGDRLAEAAIIAARVKAAIVLDEIDPDQIVVTARDLKRYKPAFEAAFQDAGLDYYLDQSIELNSLPIIHFLLDLLSLCANGFTRRQIIDCLRSPYFNLNNFALTAGDVELLNEQSLEEKIKVVAGRNQWPGATKGDPRLITGLKNIFDAVTPPDNIKSAIEYATWVEDLLAKVVNLNSVHDQGVEAINQFRRTLGQLIEQEEILKRCAHDEATMHEESVGAKFMSPFEAKFYHQHLIELITKSNFPASLPDANKILITDIEHVPNEKFKQIYVAGMLEGEFPTHNPGSGFLTPEELGQWQRFSIPVYDPRLEPGFEYALFASLINRSEQKITLSYPTADIVSSKEEPVPSFFLTSLDLVSESNQPQSLSFDTFSKTANSERNTVAYYLWHKLPLANLGNKHYLLVDFVHKLEKKLSFINKRPGYLTDHVAAGTVKINLPEYWSASQLNEYGKCPFSYWLTRALKIEPHAEPEAGLSAMEKGNFYHKALELFYKEVIDNKLYMTEEDEEALLIIFERAIADAIIWLEKESWFRPSEFWAQEKEDLSFQLRNFFTAERKRFLKEGGQFAPYMVEAEFGWQSEKPPLVIDQNGQSIKLRGKIDRIDIETGTNQSPKRLRLVDYKSGSTLPSDDDFESGRNIQLPLYALAAEQAILPGSHVEACSYLSVRAGKDRTQEGPVLQTYLNVLPDKIFQFVESIKAGDFSLNPSKPQVCENCNHQTVCRIKEFPKQLESGQEEIEREDNGDD